MSTRIIITAKHIDQNSLLDMSQATNNSSTNRTSVNQADFKNCIKLKASMNVEPKWSSQAAYGKMDEIPFYNNTVRTLEVSFQARATEQTNDFNHQELATAVERLQKFQYPVYQADGNANTIYAPPFFRVTHAEKSGASSFAPVEGYITSLRVVSVIDSQEEQAAGEAYGHIYSPAYDINFNVVVLHQLLPAWSKQGFFQGDRYYGYEGKVPGVAGANPKQRESKPLKRAPSGQDVASAVKGMK